MHPFAFRIEIERERDMRTNVVMQQEQRHFNATRQLLDDLGGPSEVAAVFLERGDVRDRMTVYQWVYANRIPAKRLPALAAMAKRRGIDPVATIGAYAIGEQLSVR